MNTNASNSTSRELQTFLDSHQYTKNGVERYEFVFGRGYISSGGLETTEELLNSVALEKASNVLDVGCGIGGGCEYLADRFGVFVHGVDLSENVIAIAKDRYSERADLKFEVKDAVTMDAPDNFFDFIYSRDCILHLNLEQKNQLFTNCYKWLKPGGKIFITDYCASPKEHWSDEFAAYVAARGYTLITIGQYAKLLEDAGFHVLKQIDLTTRWAQCLEKEKTALVSKQKEFLQRFSLEDFDELSKSWNSKMNRAKGGIQLWGWLVGEKREA